MVKVEFDPERVEEREFVRHVMKWFDDNEQPNSSGVNAQITLETKEDMATEKQVWRLRKMKYDGDPTKLTKQEASDKIKELGGS